MRMSRARACTTRDRPAAPAPAAPAFLPAADALCGALLDSRQRWRDLVTLAADLAFETDAAGRLVFVAPDPALGWPAATLLGRTPDHLLSGEAGQGAANPFRPSAPVRRQCAWLRRADGTVACLSFAAAPLYDAAGAVIGARGIAQDMTETERREGEVAAILRRGEVIDLILARMRTEVLAPRMMQAALLPLAQATGSSAAAVLDVIGDGVQPTVLHATANPAPPVLAAVKTALTDPMGAAVAADGHALLAAGAVTRFGEQVALVLCRAPGGRAWDADDRALLAAAAALVRTILEHDSIQREMARQARTDPLTGLFNRRAFMDELARRIDRLERDGLPGALLYIDLDQFKALNDLRGHDAGDAALCQTAHLLRQVTRPTDLLARFGGDEFVIWLDGADAFAAAERAEQLRLAGPRLLAEAPGGQGPRLTLSIGIAARWPGHGEDADSLLHRADQAMYAVKRAGRGHWRVAQPGEDP
jgi:diguanylate cyclase (GGDEF)-like protein/PAS domain S-box-containing protein